MCSLSSPALVTSQSGLSSSSAKPGQAFISCSDGSLVCHDLQQHVSRWQRKLGGPCQGLALIGTGDAASSEHWQSDAASEEADLAPSPLKRAKLTPQECWHGRQYGILACTGSGAVHMVCRDTGTDLVIQHKLPGDIFGQPAAVGAMALIGCRDDCLYLLDVG